MAHCGRKHGRCGRCEQPLDFDFTMAFQPIVDVSRAEIWGYEALVRGPNGESAASVLARVDEHNLYAFDQACRVRALTRAHELGLGGVLSINFLPNAIYEPSACIQATLAKADAIGWPVERLSFEIVETEYVRDREHLRHIVTAYHAMGFGTALDDFGTGYANLDMLVDLHPTTIKVDRHLISDVPRQPRQAAVVEQLVALGKRLTINVVAEGVETEAEALWLYTRGVCRQQGYFYAQPSLGLPVCDLAQLASVRDAELVV